jgi:hypothetical protein
VPEGGGVEGELSTISCGRFAAASRELKLFAVLALRRMARLTGPLPATAEVTSTET